MKKRHTIVLGITSGIAAYKTLELIKQLRKDDISVVTIMTDKAQQMIDIKDVENTSGNKVFTQLFDKNFDYKKVLKDREVEHIAIADNAEVMIIAPATANVIAKLAHGMADDFLTTTALAVTAPIILCPSMNVNMWHNPLVQENIKKLKSLGYIIIDPTAGMLACGYEGVGRLAEINDIKNEIINQLQITNAMSGKKVLVTAGGTKEKIDDVRFITNRSSGKMGAAIADICFERGADVLLLRANNSVPSRHHMKEEIFETAEDLLLLMKKYAPKYDICFHSAAVSDFSVKNKIQGKLSSEKETIIKLEPQIKIIEQIKKFNSRIKLIAFKAEYESDQNVLKQLAYKKLEESHADAIIANDISKKDRGFEAENNEAVLVLPDHHSKFFSLSTKKEIAGKIVDYINSVFY